MNDDESAGATGSLDLDTWAHRMFAEVRPDETERHTVEVCRSALIRAGWPAAKLKFRFFRRLPHEVRGATLGASGVCWVAVDQELAELRETIFHEAGHALVAPGGSAEAEERADRFAHEMMRRQGWNS